MIKPGLAALRLAASVCAHAQEAGWPSRPLHFVAEMFKLQAGARLQVVWAALMKEDRGSPPSTSG